MGAGFLEDEGEIFESGGEDRDACVVEVDWHDGGVGVYGWCEEIELDESDFDDCSDALFEASEGLE